MSLSELPQAGSPVDLSQSIATVKSELIRRRDGKLKPPKTLAKDQWPPDYESVMAWRQDQLTRIELDKSGDLAKAAIKYYTNRRVEFINHWVDTYDPRRAATFEPVKIPLVLFQRQQELVTFVESCVAAEGAGLIEKTRDMGATWVCAAMSVHYFLFGQPVAIGWGSQTQDKVDRLGDPSTVFEKIRMILLGIPGFFRPPDLEEHLNYMRCVNPKTGATIVGEIGDNIGRGGRTMVYFVDEAAHLNRPEKVEASLLDTTRTRIDISSVSGLGTVYWRKREAGVDWMPGQRAVRERTNVFVLDWRDHPLKTEAWYNERRTDMESKGLSHVFAQEIDRNYAASVEGVIIPAEWVVASIDAHEKLNFTAEGPAVAGLDVADSGGDTNALVARRGPVCLLAQEWGERDTGVTARRAVSICATLLPAELQYDAAGVGSGVKAETNRLADDKLLPKGLKIIPWNAAAKVNAPNDYVISGDRNSPRNKDFYQNLKAQAWWMLRRRFELTFHLVNGTYQLGDIDTDELISLPSTMPLLRKLQKELSQATVSRKSTTLKLVVDKSPEGTKSPNIADALVMAFWPVAIPQAHLALGGFQVLRQRG